MLRHATRVCRSNARINNKTIILKPNYKTLPVYNPNKNEELTLYIKGFMSKGEKATDFKKWIDSHDAFVHQGLWNDGPAKGWAWYSGVKQYPYPLALGLKLGTTFYKGSKFTRITPVSFAALGALDLGIYSLRLIYQYHHINGEIEKMSTKLSDDLVRLSKKYGKVRIVAHSLGCRLLLNSLIQVPTEYLPNSIHLCAPALLINEFEDFVYSNDNRYGMCKDRMYVYYAKNDAVLSILYRTLNGFVDDKSIVGVSGLGNLVSYDNDKIIQMDAYNYLNNYWFVHNNYHKCLHSIYISPPKRSS